MPRHVVFRSVLVVGAGSLAACYFVTPYSDLTSADGLDASISPAPDGAPSAKSDAGTLDADSGDAAPVDPDLLGHWTFDDEEGSEGIAHDVSGAGHDLLLEDAVTGPPGHAGSEGALQYPDGKGVAHNDALGTDFPPAGTLSVWAYFPPPATDVQRAIFDLYDATRHHLYIRYSPGNADASTSQPLDFASQVDTGFDFFASPSPVVPTGTWTHLVVVWDRTNVPNMAHFYVDGVGEAGASFMPSDAPISQLFTLSNGYAGQYDDISFWKRAFTEEEVREIP